MKKENLVYIKEANQGFSVVHCNSHFEPHKQYRCIELSEGKHSEYLIYGVIFSQEEFEKLFDYVHERTISNWKKIGLVKENGGSISKSAFKTLADVHKYGSGKSGFNIAYFSTHPKECMYAFFPEFQGDSKAKTLNTAYEMYLATLKGCMDDFDCYDIQFCNTGIPLSMSLSTKLKARWLDPRPLSIL